MASCSFVSFFLNDLERKNSGSFDGKGQSDKGIKQAFLCNLWAWSSLCIAPKLHPIVDFCGSDRDFSRGVDFCLTPFPFLLLLALYVYLGTPFWYFSLFTHTFTYLSKKDKLSIEKGALEYMRHIQRASKRRVIIDTSMKNILYLYK